jgi:hypothetical protein
MASLFNCSSPANHGSRGSSFDEYAMISARTYVVIGWERAYNVRVGAVGDECGHGAGLAHVKRRSPVLVTHGH